MPVELPGLNLIAQPGQRRATLDMAREIERRGFAQIRYRVPSPIWRNASGSPCDRAHLLRHRDRADLRPDGRGIRLYRRLYPRVSGGRFQFGIGVAHGAEPCPDGGHPGQAARRHPRLCREVPLLRQCRRAAADRPRHLAQADDRARRRDRRRHGVRQWRPLAHGPVARGACRRRSATTRLSLSATASAPASTDDVAEARRSCAAR